MSELISEASRGSIEEALALFINNITKAQDFAIDQIPGVVEEILRWKQIESFYAWTMCILAIMTFVSLFVFAIYRILSYESVPDRKFSVDAYCGFAIASGVISLIWLIVLSDWNKATIDWLQIWLAPKAYLIDYAFQLAK